MRVSGTRQMIFTNITNILTTPIECKPAVAVAETQKIPDPDPVPDPDLLLNHMYNGRRLAGNNGNNNSPYEKRHKK